MQIMTKPYFLENEKWYKYNGYMYKLTKEAPQKAIESYKEQYKKLVSGHGKKEVERMGQWIDEHMYDDETFR